MKMMLKRNNIAALLVVCTISGAAIIASCSSQGSTKAITDGEPGPAAQKLRDVTSPQIRERGISFMAIEGPSGTVGYIAEQRVRAKSGAFTVRVVMDNNYRVKQAEALEYSGQRGDAVCYPSFTRQFKDKTPEASIRVGEDIDAATGATVSSRTMADAVRRLIRLAKKEFSEPGL